LKVSSLGELRREFEVEDPAKSLGREIATEAGSRLPLPRSVKVLGSLYLLVGGLALIETIWAAFQGRFYLGIDVIAIPLGVGLLRGSPAWRKLVLCAAVVQILVIGLMAYLIYRNGEQFADLWAGLSAKVGPLFGKVVLGALAALTVAVLAVSVWSIRLLTRNDVKRVFQPGGNFDRRSGLLPAVALVLLLVMTARETGGFSLHYFHMSEEGTSFRILLDRIHLDTDDGLALLGLEAPCLIEVRGMGEEWYRVVTTVTVRRHGAETSTDSESKSYGGLGTSQLSPSLRNSTDRIVVEIDKPQLSGGYWLPLSKHFTVEYRARIHGEGKYESFRDEVEEKRNVSVSGLCSVYDLNQWLLARTEKEAFEKIMSSARQAADVPSQLLRRGNDALRKSEYDRAIKDFDKAIRLDPNNAAAFSDRGVAWFYKKEYDKAIEDYDEAIRLYPEYALAFFNRGLAWLCKKEYDNAIKDYDKATKCFDETIREGERSPNAVLLGYVAARQAGNEPAAKRFLTVSAGKLNEAWPYPVVQFLRGDIDEAALLKLSTDDDKRTDARCFLGMDHAIKGRRGEALTHFRWVKEHGKPAHIAYTIAVAELERLERPADEPRR
jgi:tetratricopeptide (TPR) repeat protein